MTKAKPAAEKPEKTPKPAKPPPRPADHVEHDNDGPHVFVWVSGSEGALVRQRAKVYIPTEPNPDAPAGTLRIVDTGYGLRVIVATEDGTWREGRLTVV